MYYVDFNGRYPDVIDCSRDMTKYHEVKAEGGHNLRKFKNYYDAKEALDSILAGKNVTVTTSAKQTPAKKETDVADGPNATGCSIIGCDEVGKSEPFKQMMSVAVFADPKKSRADLKTGDSKGHGKQTDVKTGKAVTGLESFSDVDGNAHYNDEYGVIYCVKIITNSEYNDYKKTIGNANAVLAHLHNESIFAVYNKAKELGLSVDYFVIDDYINKKSESCERFANYIGLVDPNAQKISDIKDAKLYMTPKAESKYPDTVGLASNIGNFIDQLWQEKCKADFLAYGIEFSDEWFGNFNVAADKPGGINEVFRLIEEKCGSLDASPVVCKHTSYYENFMKIKNG